MQLWSSWKGRLPRASFVLRSGLRMIHQDRPTLESNWPQHEQCRYFTAPSPLSPRGAWIPRFKIVFWRKARLNFKVQKELPLGWAWSLVFIEFLENFEFQTGSIWALHVAPSQGCYFDFFEKIKMGNLWVRHLSRIWKFSKFGVCLIFSAGGSQIAPPQGVLSWGLKFKICLLLGASQMAPPQGANFILKK